MIEIENSTNFLNSLRKFYEIRDFLTQMTIVAPERRKKQFDDIIKSDLFSEIRIG